MSQEHAPPKPILYVHPSDELYGADLILLQLISGLDRRRFRPIVVLADDLPFPGLLSQALREQGVKTIHFRLAVLRRQYFRPLGILLFLWRLFASVLFLCWLIRRERVEVVHSNTLAVLSGALAARLTGITHIWHVHEILLRPRFLRRLTAWLAPRLSERVVAVSTATYDNLCTADPLNAAKATVVHNGLDTRRVDAGRGRGQAVRASWGVPSDAPLIGMVGRLSHWKGQDYFLEVAALVHQARPAARFAIVGGTVAGQEGRVVELRAAIDRLGLTSVMTLDNFREDVGAVLDAYDLFVMPSILPDPFPTVVLEAMAAGRPVIANAHGGSTELVIDGRTGMLVPPGQAEAMAAAIISMIDQPARAQEMGHEGRRRIEQQFSLERFITRWSQIYADLGAPASEVLTV